VNSLKEYGQWCNDISFNVADVDGIIEKHTGGKLEREE
jgi:type III restriction enzyme